MKTPNLPNPTTFEEALAADRAAGYSIYPSQIAAGVMFAFLVKPSGKTLLRVYRGERSARAKYEGSYKTLRQAKLFAQEYAKGQVENAIYDAEKRARAR